MREAYDLKIFENKVLREMSAVRNVKSHVRKNFVIHIVLLVLFKLLLLHISYAMCKMDTFLQVISECSNIRTTGTWLIWMKFGLRQIHYKLSHKFNVWLIKTFTSDNGFLLLLLNIQQTTPILYHVHISLTWYLLKRHNLGEFLYKNHDWL